MARTPLLGALQDAFAEVAAEERRTSRRDFLKESALAAPRSPLRTVRNERSGGGPGGDDRDRRRGARRPHGRLPAEQAGVVAQVHEASEDRIGGRCWSGTLGGQVYEHGGELIDQGHNQIRNLAQELGLKLDNLVQAESNGTEQTNWFDGALLVRGGDRRHQDRLAEDPHGRVGGELPDAP